MLYLTIIGGAFIAWLILAVLFTPHVPYHIEAEIDARSDHFIHVIESTCSTHLEPDNRVDILKVIDLDDIPFPGAHHVPLKPGHVGDVLRVDMAIDSSFPNGRPIIGGIDRNHEQADVSDVILTLVLSPDPSTVQIGDGVDYSAVQRRESFPYIPLALQGLAQGHGVPANGTPTN